MKMYKIEIDEEVFKFLKDNAEPFEDTTPNSVLRKLLFGRHITTVSGNETTHLEGITNFPSSVPKALAHVLEVLFLVKRLGYSRIDATSMVADKWKVAYQTIIDQYTRQLNKKSFEIDNLLNDQNLVEFQVLLEKKFQNHVDVIRSTFKALS